MQSIETFHTDRLIVARINQSDYVELCRMHRDPRVMATLGGVRSDDETVQFLREKMDQWKTHGYGMWMFRDKDEGHFVGRGGLLNTAVGGSEEVEVGYSVRAEYWGKGLATEMAEAILAVGFEQLGLTNIVCFTLTSNLASRKVMEKVGFKFERDIIHGGQPHVLYRLKR